jgi:hypothetical protein
VIITTTEQILSSSWNENKNEVFPLRTPARWFGTTPPGLDDIKLWEEIFYQPGLIGVYVSWEPYEEFYIIVHLLHLDKQFIEVFYEDDAVDRVLERCKYFNIMLPSKEIFVES